MDIGRCFKDAWNLVMKDLAPLAVTAVVAAIVLGVGALVVTVGAGGAMFAGNALQIDAATGELATSGVNWAVAVLVGLVVAVLAVCVMAWEYNVLLKMMLRRVREGRAAQMGDMAQGMQGIGAFVVALVVLGILTGIGFALLIIPGLILMTIWVYVLVVIADRRSGLSEAMSESVALAKKPGYVMTFVTLLVVGVAYSIVSWILAMIPVVGWIISLFLGLYLLAYVVSMYFQARDETHLLDHALYGAPLPPDATGDVGYPSAPAAPGVTFPPAPPAPAPSPPPAPAAPPEPAPAAPPPPAPAPPPAPSPDAWAAAADPLASPTPPFEPPATSVPPEDEGPGTA